jgi:hypothetical protein
MKKQTFSGSASINIVADAFKVCATALDVVNYVD